MKWTIRSVWELLAIIVMAMVVLILATLEFRWTGEISRIEQDRLQSALDTSVRNFNQEFSYDFDRLCESFEVNPEGPPSSLGDRVLHRYAEWMNTTSRPDLVAGIYVWNTPQGRASSLESLDLDGRRFHEAVWPADLASLHEFLVQHLGRLSSKVSDREAVYYPWIFYENTPALVRPAFQVSQTEASSGSGLQPYGYVIIALSGSFLEHGYLRELVARHFGQLGFGVAIRSAQPPYQAIFLSDPSVPISTSSPDAALNLFDSVSEEARRRGHPSIQPSSQVRQWQLVVQHPAGSLEGAVASLRRRNLVLSLGLLAILVGSIVLVFSVARRAERLAKLQMEFVAGVSHELCTPLAVINSAVENLADGVVDNPGQVLEYADILRDQGSRLERLLDQVLLFASRRFRRSEFDLQAVDVAPVVSQCIATSEPMLRDAGFTVEKEIASDLPLVLADPSLVSSCLDNLVSNAMKYAGTNRHIAVRARLGRTSSHPEVQVSVEDQGTGISAADLPHIFEPFYRVQSVRDSQIRGVGLGLHLVGRMIESMGGRVTVRSEIGRGTCFTLHFRVAKSPENCNEMRAIRA